MPSSPSASASRALASAVGQAEHEGRGREDVARVRLEGQHDRRHAALLRLGLQRREDMLVAAVEAVEIADGDDAALERSRHVVETGKPDEA